MNEQDIELLSRYLDGELPAAEREQLEYRIGSESELRSTLHNFQRVDRQLRQALTREGQVPVEVAALLTEQDDRIAVLPTRNRPRWGMAIAASVLAGVAMVSGPQWVADSQDNLLVPNIEESVAFSKILEQESSRASGWLPVEDEVQMRPLLSFASNGGTYCREFLASEGEANPDKPAWRGVACRREGSWDVELLVQTPGLAAENAGYQTASAETADLVADFIDANSADIPLGLEQEAELITNNWH